jgi:dCMP deaminase
MREQHGFVGYQSQEKTSCVKCGLPEDHAVHVPHPVGQPAARITPRRSRDSMYEDIVGIVADRSTCLRAKVGAIIVVDGRVASMGYNGSPPGREHCLDAGCLIDPDTGGCVRTIHAEQNAIAWAARAGVSTQDATMYCGYSPCLECAKLILAAGISEFIYYMEYRDGYANLLRDGGVIVRKR